MPSLQIQSVHLTGLIEDQIILKKKQKKQQHSTNENAQEKY